MSTTPPGDKQFFKIGEVAEIVGVKPHVLRYWEAEFRQLKPMKTRGAHRMYRRVDVEVACVIRRLLQDEGYTVAGAGKRLKELLGGEQPCEERATAQREVALRAELLAVRAELQDALCVLDRERDESPPPLSTVTITSIAQARAIVPARKTR